MATEAHYAEMWAQDSAAMYGYAGQLGGRFDVGAVHAAQIDDEPGRPDQSVRRGGPGRRHSRRQPRADRCFDIAVGGAFDLAGALTADPVGVRPLGTVYRQRCDAGILKRLGRVWRAECAYGSRGLDG